MRRLFALLVAALLALTLTGCRPDSGSSYGYYDSICVDPYTQLRVPDYECGYHHSWWYYVPSGAYVPGYHHHITHYSTVHYHVPSNAVVHTGGVPAFGGKAKKFTTGVHTYAPPRSTKTGGVYHKIKTGYTKIKSKFGRH